MYVFFFFCFLFFHPPADGLKNTAHCPSVSCVVVVCSAVLKAPLLLLPYQNSQKNIVRRDNHHAIVNV